MRDGAHMVPFDRDCTRSQVFALMHQLVLLSRILLLHCYGKWGFRMLKPTVRGSKKVHQIENRFVHARRVV